MARTGVRFPVPGWLGSHHPGHCLRLPAPGIHCRLSALCSDIGGQAVEQEGFGTGQANREEQRDVICPSRRYLASTDCSKEDEPLTVPGTGQHIRREIAPDLLQQVGDQQ